MHKRWVGMAVFAVTIAAMGACFALAQMNEIRAVPHSVSVSAETAVHESGRSYDDFEDGVMDSEWTALGVVIESEGVLQLGAFYSPSISTARTSIYSDTSQTLSAVFEAVTMPNGAAFFADIGTQAGTDYVRVAVGRNNLGLPYFDLADERGLIGSTSGTAAAQYILEVRKRGTSTAVYINNAPLGGSADPDRVALPSDTCARIGATTSLFNPLVARADSVEFRSAAIRGPSLSAPRLWTLYK